MGIKGRYCPQSSGSILFLCDLKMEPPNQTLTCKAIQMGIECWIRPHRDRPNSGSVPSANLTYRCQTETFQAIWKHMCLRGNSSYLRQVRRDFVSVPTIQPEAVSSHLSCLWAIESGIRAERITSLNPAAYRKRRFVDNKRTQEPSKDYC
nr:unnamed protein product [Haemonchus contortus]